MKKAVLFLCMAGILATTGCQSKQISGNSSVPSSKYAGMSSEQSYAGSSNNSFCPEKTSSAASHAGSSTVPQTNASAGRLEATKEVKTPDARGISGLNNFAVNLYSKLYEKDKNIFFSPASIYLALGMTYNGAAGNTAKGMASVLGASSLSLKEYNSFNRDLQYSLTGNKYVKFELANSMWINNCYSKNIKQDFLKRNTDYYGAMVSALNLGILRFTF